MTRRARSLAVGITVAVLVVLALVVGRGGDASGPVAVPTAGPGSARASVRASAPAAQPSRGGTEVSKDPASGLPLVELGSLPRQVRDTVALIDRGGPYQHRQDGAVFSNRERVLPRQASGYYHEYTVETPGSDDRGARRVVTGDRDRLFFYTGDHYASFVRIRR